MTIVITGTVRKRVSLDVSYRTHVARMWSRPSVERVGASFKKIWMMMRSAAPRHRQYFVICTYSVLLHVICENVYRDRLVDVDVVNEFMRLGVGIRGKMTLPITDGSESDAVLANLDRWGRKASGFGSCHRPHLLDPSCYPQVCLAWVLGCCQKTSSFFALVGQHPFWYLCIRLKSHRNALELSIGFV